MPTRAEELKVVENAIIDVLESYGEPMSPRALVDVLKERNLKEDIVRAAMWYLIDREEIDLTIERQISRARAA